jgi:hypothetical protein
MKEHKPKKLIKFIKKNKNIIKAIFNNDHKIPYLENLSDLSELD